MLVRETLVAVRSLRLALQLVLRGIRFGLISLSFPKGESS